jgi:hypothetical protein
MYDAAIQGMHDELLSTSMTPGLVFIEKWWENGLQNGSLGLFMRGLLGLGAFSYRSTGIRVR